jgi:hypothetical protein
VELGDASVVPPLLAFLRLYRSDSSFEGAPDALIEAARGVLKHGGAEGSAQLASVTGDGRAHAALGHAVAALLAPAEAPTPQATAVAAAPPPPSLPRTLSRESVAETFRTHEAELRTCLQAELAQNPKLAQLRVSFVAESDGSAHAFQVAPASASLGDCLYPKLADYRFPRFATGRRLVRHTLTITRPADATEPVMGGDVETTWWSSAAKTPRKADPLLSPWWQSAHPIAPLVAREESPRPIAPSNASTIEVPKADPEPPEVESDAWWTPVAPGPQTTPQPAAPLPPTSAPTQTKSP